MLTRIHKATEGRIQTDPRINLMGERVDRVWADPILILRKDIVRWSPGKEYDQGGIVMKEKAKNVKTDRKFWNDPMSFPVFGPKRNK